MGSRGAKVGRWWFWGNGGGGEWSVASGGRGEERLATPWDPPDHSHANEELLRQQPRCQRKPWQVRTHGALALFAGGAREVAEGLGGFRRAHTWDELRGTSLSHWWVAVLVLHADGGTTCKPEPGPPGSKMAGVGVWQKSV